MKKVIPKIGSALVAACLAFSSLPIMAASTDKIQVELVDVTNSANTLKGEAKVKVKIKGAKGKTTIAQTSLDYQGDLKYKSTQFLKGENNPNGKNFRTAQEKDNCITSAIISINGITFSEDEEVFVITFNGEPGETVKVDLSKLEDNFCEVGGKTKYADGEQTITLTASDKENAGKKASVRLVMDKVSGFTATGESGITVKITNEKQKGDEINTTINTAMTSKGGHRDGTTSTPTFVVDNTVIAEDTYTVEVSGIGYVTYKKTGVKFDEELKITNADFIPGDINNDGKVDKTDKEAVEKLITDKEYSLAADYNRDNKVNSFDLEVFDGIKDDTQSGKDDKDDTGNSGNTNSGNTGSGGGGGGGGNGSGNSSNSGSGGGSFGGGGFGGGTTTTQNQENFTDLTDFDWAKDSIYTLKNKGVISGISDTEFAPAANIKRGDFILILTRMLGIKDEFTENFADVPADSYYYNAIGSAKAAGVANGDGGNFMPENSITRQDLITLAYRAFLNKGYITETDDMTVLDSFGDKASIADYATSAMASMVKAGIIKGSDGNVNPIGNATRAEVAVMCARMLDLMK